MTAFQAVQTLILQSKHILQQFISIFPTKTQQGTTTTTTRSNAHQDLTSPPQGKEVKHHANTQN